MIDKSKILTAQGDTQDGPYLLSRLPLSLLFNLLEGKILFPTWAGR